MKYLMLVKYYMYVVIIIHLHLVLAGKLEAILNFVTCI